MRAATLIGLMMLACSVLAADAQDKRADKIQTAAVDLKHGKIAAPARVATAPKSHRASAVRIDGDSRLNDYRLERESCCGPQ